ncbi:MAG: thioredoxin family protein [Anaeroplasmataceae bacterium]
MINNDNYIEVLKGFNIIEITGSSCASCVSLKPVLQKVANDKNINFNVLELSDDISKIVDLYKVVSIPTVLLLHDTTLIGKVTGFQPDEILEIWVDAKIEEFKKRL